MKNPSQMPYLTKIKLAYIELCKDPLASINLKKLTDASIKRECQELFKKKNNRSDQQVLRNFLNLKEEDDIAIALRKADAGKFKTIGSLLKNSTSKPRLETLDITAWLLNVKLVNEVLPTDEVKREEESDTKQDPPKKEGDPPEEKPAPSNRMLRNAVISFCLPLIFIGAYFFRELNPKEIIIRMPKSNEKCMYWANDHYEPIACEDTLNNSRKLIDLNLQELVNLRKINRPDTLTVDHLGTIWYRKINNKLHLFTSSGRLPSDTNKVLLPLTEHMFSEHVYGKYTGVNYWRLIFYFFAGAAILTWLIDFIIEKYKTNGRFF